jgi:cell division protein FtsI (penicillin-binding protein 3)
MAARSVSFSSSEALLRTRLPAWRSKAALGVLALAFFALAARAVYLQAFTTGYLQKQGEQRYQRTIEVPATRGRIYDRNGTILATSLPARAVWAIPEDVAAPRAKLLELARLLQVDPRELDRKLAEDKTFVYLQRQVEPQVAASVAKLGIPGIHQLNETKRHYPDGEAMSHVVGFTNVQGVGQEGFELSKQQALAGRAGVRTVIKDNLGRPIEEIGSGREPQHGTDVVLSIDSRIQFATVAALRDAVAEHRAKAGAIVVLDARTGEVLALANWPTYNPNVRQGLSGAQLRNRVITDTFEPGSTMKSFSTALALELGRVRPSTVIETGNGRMTIGSHTISDVKAHGPLTVEQVMQKSSNVGTVHMALQLPPERMWGLYTSLGFGQPPQLGFPGAVAGRVRPHASWRQIDQATMSYGHGMSVSLIQLARAYTVFARNGELVPVTMLRADAEVPGTRVLKPETAQAMRRMLELAAGPQGTATLAQVPGYRVGGKTGTAHKVENGKYVNKYVASFVGLAPMSSPRVVIAVMIDEPSAGKHFGGQVAAPVFSRVAEEAMRALRLPPDAPVDSVIQPAEPVRESV